MATPNDRPPLDPLIELTATVEVASALLQKEGKEILEKDISREEKMRLYTAAVMKFIHDTSFCLSKGRRPGLCIASLPMQSVDSMERLLGLVEGKAYALQWSGGVPFVATLKAKISPGLTRPDENAVYKVIFTVAGCEDLVITQRVLNIHGGLRVRLAVMEEYSV